MTEICTIMPQKDIFQIHDLSFVPLISEDEIRERVSVLGQELTHRLAGKNPLFISILSGAFVFASDLIRAFDSHCEIGFVKLKSYEGTRSSGDVQTVMGLDKSLKDRHLVVVEDIVDTGRTLHFFLDHLRAQEPASITTVTVTAVSPEPLLGKATAQPSAHLKAPGSSGRVAFSPPP